MASRILLIICLAVVFASTPACSTLSNTGARLTDEQKNYLDQALPKNVREILENSDKFAILADNGETSKSGFDFTPTRIVLITDDSLKRELLQSLYHDVAVNPVRAACYSPHHGIQAEYMGQKVKIDICFTCARIEVLSPTGGSFGAMILEGRELEGKVVKLINDEGKPLAK